MISVMPAFKLHELINKYFRNEEDSRSFISEMDNYMTIKMNANHELATKSDIKRLETEIVGINSRISDLEIGMNSKISDIEIGLNSKMSGLEIKMREGFSDLLKWIIALMVGGTSIILTFFKILS